MGQRGAGWCAFAFAVALAVGPRAVLASSTGITGYSGNPSTCASCHSGGSYSGTASITSGLGYSMSTNSSRVFTVGLSSNAVGAGFDISNTGSGSLSATGGGTQLIGSEVTHTGPQTLSGGAASWTVTYIAPNATGSDTLYVCINQVNLGGDGNAGDGPPACTTRTITITNSAPTISGFTNVASYTEGGAAVAVDGSITLADVDGDSLNRAVMTITNVQTGDTLSCPGCAGAGLASSFSAGALTITGTSTVSSYASVLQGVTFSNSSQAPSTITRSISLTVRDTFNNTSSTASTTLGVTAVNDAPGITAPASIGVTEDVASALTGISFSDVDSASGTLTATFTVASGTLSAPACGSVTTGGTATARTLTGTTTNLNTCISGSNLTFTTAANATSTVSLGVQVSDNGNTGTGGAQTASTTVSLTVTAVNDAPSITAPASIQVTEDVAGALTGISFSDVDSASGSLTATLSVGSGTINSPVCGSVTVGGTATARTLAGTTTNLNSCFSGGNVTFTTAANATSSVTLGIALTDNGNTGSGGAQAATPASVTINVTPVEDPPTAVDDPAMSSPKNATNTPLDVLANDTDPDVGDTLSLVSVTAPSHGTAAVGNGSNCTANTVCYTPTLNYSGSDTFGYTMQDSQGQQSSATVTLTVAAGTAPVASSFAVGTSPLILEDATSVTIDALAHVTDADAGDTETIVSVNNSSSFPVATTHGSVSLSGTSAGNTILYTPNADYFGTDSFTYIVQDAGQLNSNSATVTVTLTSVNDAPTLTAIANPSALNEDAGLQTVNLAGIGSGASNEAQTLTVTAVSSNTALIPNPTVTYTSANATGSLGYTPVANQFGTATITVTVQDNGGTANGGVDTLQRQFTVTVNSVNDAPALNAIGAVTLNEDPGPQTVNLAGIGAGPANESAQTLTITATSSNTALIPNPAVTYTSPNATGSLSYTPVTNANGTATITVTVQDNGGTANGGVDTRQRSFVVTVNAVNDAPTVAAIPNQQVNDAQLFGYDAQVTDPDDTSFTYSLTNAPAWLSIDASGHIGGTPPIGTSATYTPTVHAFDPSLAEGTTTFTLVVSAPDADGDGIPDSYETLYSSVLDPNNPNDAALDPDRDGLTNLQEYLAGLNPTIDDVAPALSVPADLVVPSTGYYTVVDLGTATAVDAHDGTLVPTSTWTRPVVRPGAYDVIWSATDLAGNTATATQHVDVLPRADFALDQVSGEGQVRQVTVTLNGTSPGCPGTAPTVTYTVGGTAGASDSDAAGGTLTIPCAGSAASIPVAIAADGVTEPNETIVFTLTGATGATPGSQTAHTLTIVDANAAPSVALTAFQGAYPRLVAYASDGTFTVAADAIDPNNDALAYDWSASDDALGIDAASGANATFDPSGVAAGTYTARVTVSDGNGGTASASVLLSVAAGTSTLVDVDGDGIDDSLDAITDFNAVLPNETGAPLTTLLLETDPGLALTLGRTALAAGRNGALVEMADVVTYGVGAGGIAYGADSYDNVGGVFDYEIHGVAAGGTARVVLPLQSALRAGARFRKFQPSTGWQDFVSDARNSVASAASSFGQCPGPSSAQYVAGLQPFADCVRLTLQDGGPNDADGVADGVIRDPAGAAQGATPVAATPSPGGGAFNAFWLLGAILLRLRRRACHPEAQRAEGSPKRSLAALGMTLLCVAAPTHADMEKLLRYSGELSSGYDTNVGNAENAPDERESGSVSGAANAELLLEPTLYTTILLRGSLAGEQVQSFTKLSNQKVTGMARYMIRPDGDFFSPVMGLWASAAYWNFGSALRDSNEYRAGILATQNLTTQISGRFALSYVKRDSDSRVFDTTGASASLNVDWRPVEAVTVYGGYTYYRGDVVSTATTPGPLKIVLAADAIEPDDAFGGFGTSQFAYRLHAHSNIGTLGLNYPFSRRFSADAQAQFIDTHGEYDNHYLRWVGVLSLLARF